MPASRGSFSGNAELTSPIASLIPSSIRLRRGAGVSDVRKKAEQDGAISTGCSRRSVFTDIRTSASQLLIWAVSFHFLCLLLCRLTQIFPDMYSPANALFFYSVTASKPSTFYCFGGSKACRRQYLAAPGAGWRPTTVAHWPGPLEAAVTSRYSSS